MKGNKVNMSDFGNYRRTIAKCGMLSLEWITCPYIPAHRFEIISGDEILLETFSIERAMKKYNELVI